MFRDRDVRCNKCGEAAREGMKECPNCGEIIEIGSRESFRGQKMEEAMEILDLIDDETYQVKGGDSSSLVSKIKKFAQDDLEERKRADSLEEEARKDKQKNENKESTDEEEIEEIEE